MLDPPRTPGRALAARRARDVDVYGGAGEAAEGNRPNVFLVIWRRRWIVLACLVLGLIGGAVFNYRATPIFSSGSVIYVQDNALKMMDDPMGASHSQGYLVTQCQLITSTTILSAALDKPDVMRASCLQGVDNPVGVLKASVTAAPDKISDLITVSMESTKPEDAAVIVNAVIEAYIDYQGRQHKSSAVEVLRIFQREVDQHEKDLEDKQQARLKLKQDNPDLALEAETGGPTISKLGTLSTRLTEAQLRQLELKTAAEEAEALKDDPTALKRLMDRYQVGDEKDSVLDPGLLADYRQSRKTLDELLDRLGSNNQLVKEAQKQIARQQDELTQASRDAAQNYASLLKEELRIADAHVNDYTAAIKAARTSAIDLNFKKDEYDQLEQDIQRITRSLELLDSRVKEVNVNEDVGSLTVSVLETAKPAYLPVRPNKGKNMGLALVGGLMAGVGLAMLRDLLDQRLRSAEEITSLLDLAILGVVPHMLGKGRLAQRGRIVQSQPRSNVSEAYRTIRTALSFGLNETGAKTILFTSPAPGDGKSTSVSNLALAFALSGRRTLLIDADCRRPTQDRIYECQSGLGLADVLGGTAPLAEAIRPSGIDKLDVLPCGTLPHNPAELLDSQALIDLLTELSGKYDQILIDSPPVVPVTDARILAASCDAVVMVLRADRSTRRLATHARDAMQSVGANLIGVVVNDVPRGEGGYGYDYYGVSHYGYKAAPRVAANGNGAGVMQVSQRTIDG